MPTGPDSNYDREQLLLHVAVTRPKDATELATWIGRPRQSVQDDLLLLIADGAVLAHNDELLASAAARIVAAANPLLVQGIHDRVLAEMRAATHPRTETLVALAESGCHDESLLELLIRAEAGEASDATVTAAVALVARSRGYSHHQLRVLRATQAALDGRADAVLSLTDDLITSQDPAIARQAALLAGGTHISAGRLERASTIYEHVGSEALGQNAAWAVVAAVGHGDLAAAQRWRSGMTTGGLTSHSAGLIELAEGLLRSLDTSDAEALDLLTRAAMTLGPVADAMVLPESPAALAAIVAIGRGEPQVAEFVLQRALDTNMGGSATRQRHILLSAWAFMAQGKLEAAETTLASLNSQPPLCERDQLLFWALQAGIARRRADVQAMKDAWRQLRGQTFGVTITLYDLLPLGEMLFLAARLRDTDRVRELVATALSLLERLGNPIAWSVPLHWCGVQAAFQAEDPQALIPHAAALASAGKISSHAASLAQAGDTWLAVLRGDTNFASVEASARALAAQGLAWDASRLAGQAALQHPDRDGALSMMQLAREISKVQVERTAPQLNHAPSGLTSREIEVGRLVLEGEGYRAIGEQLFISPKTVEHHVARIRGRLGASSRSELLDKLHEIVQQLDG